MVKSFSASELLGNINGLLVALGDISSIRSDKIEGLLVKVAVDYNF